MITPLTVQWGLQEEAVDSPEELNTLLDRIWSQPGNDGAPFIVTLYNATGYDPDADDAELPANAQAGIGDPRGLGWYFDERGIAFDPTVDAPPEPANPWDWSWDFGDQRTGVRTWRIRLRHDTVRALLLAFMTGEEVPGVEWGLEDPNPAPEEDHDAWLERIGSINELGEASPHHKPPVLPDGPGSLGRELGR